MKPPARPIQIAPGPGLGAFLRSIPQVRNNSVGFLGQVHREHGQLVQFPTPLPVFSTINPSDVDHVLRANSRNYTKQTLQYQSLRMVTGEGLLTSDGEIWKAHRRAVQPAFHHTMQATIEQATDDAFEHYRQVWAEQSKIEIQAALQHLSLEVVARALFGTSLSGDAGAIALATVRALKVVIAKARTPLPIPATWPTPNNVRLQSAVRELDAAVAHLLAQPDVNPDSFISLLRESHNANPVTFDAQAVRDEIVTFIVAGHETVASAMAWALQLLHAHPAELQRATADAQYMQHVFAETLRLYPPAWLITRSAIEPDRLSDTDIPAGSLVIISPYLMHRTAGWSDPEQFRPARFEAGVSEVARADYLPFGLGARMCIGRDMALVEGPRLLSKLLAAFDITPSGDWQRLGMTQGVTLHPTKPMPAAIRPR